MLKVSRFFLRAIAIVVAAIVLFLIYVLSTGRVPTDEAWLFDHVNHGFNQQLKVEQVTGGGHFFWMDGRDLWLRFRDARPASSPELPTLYDPVYRFQPCSAEQQESVRSFFYDVSERPSWLAYLTPWSDISERDRQSLTDTQNLKCLNLGTIKNAFGDHPGTIGTWWLYNVKTQFHYFRYASFN